MYEKCYINKMCDNEVWRETKDKGANEVLFCRSVFLSAHRYGRSAAERREGRVGGGEQVGGGWEALDEGAGGRELSVLLCGTVSGLPALHRHAAPEALNSVAHAGVKPARSRQTALGDARRRETSKSGDAEELWG